MKRKHKIYFACSITGQQGGKRDKQAIVDTLKKLGHEVLSDSFVHKNLKNRTKKSSNEELYTYIQCMDWIKNCSVVVADVSKLSMGVGYEIGWSIRDKKKVVALSKESSHDKLTLMIKGNTEPYLKVHTWKHKSDLLKILTKELGS